MSKQCQQELRAIGRTYPRTCQVCQLGPCHKKLTAQAAPVADAPGMPGVERKELEVALAKHNFYSLYNYLVKNMKFDGTVPLTPKFQELLTIESHVQERLREETEKLTKALNQAIEAGAIRWEDEKPAEGTLSGLPEGIWSHCYLVGPFDGPQNKYPELGAYLRSRSTQDGKGVER